MKRPSVPNRPVVMPAPGDDHVMRGLDRPVGQLFWKEGVPLDQQKPVSTPDDVLRRILPTERANMKTRSP